MQKKAAQKAQMAANDRARQSYITERDNKLDAVRDEKAQKRKESSQKLEKVSKERMEAQAQARVSASEAGVAGLSIDVLLNDFEAQEGLTASNIESNFNFASRNAERQETAAINSAQAKLDSLQPAVKANFWRTLTINTINTAVAAGTAGMASGDAGATSTKQATSTSINTGQQSFSSSYTPQNMSTNPNMSLGQTSTQRSYKIGGLQ